MNDTPLQPEIFVLGALLLQIPFLMIILAHVLAPRPLQAWNTAAAPLSMVMAFLAWPSDADDWIHVIAQIALLASVLWLIWRPSVRRSPPSNAYLWKNLWTAGTRLHAFHLAPSPMRLTNCRGCQADNAIYSCDKLGRDVPLWCQRARQSGRERSGK